MVGKLLKIAGARYTEIADTILDHAWGEGGITHNSAGSINFSAGKDITFGPYNMAASESGDLRVMEITTRATEILRGNTYTFEVVRFSREINSLTELEQVKWAYKIDDEEIQDFPERGTITGGTVTKRIEIADDFYGHQKLTIYAYINDKEGEGILELNMDIITVTTKDGKYLFSLRPNSEHTAEKLTAKEIYDKGIQWFCPYADNYLELIHKDENLKTFSELKHFSWEDIVKFAETERWNLNYASGWSGDWKVSPLGGAGYLLITVGEYPYWTDAIGQIPFSVDVFTDYLEEHGDKEKATKETLAKGQQFGDGGLMNAIGLGGGSDFSNGYDNHIILRACLWASKRYDVSKVTTSILGIDVKETYELKKNNYDPNHLGRKISEQDYKNYLKND